MKLLLEIGCEEIPDWMIDGALDHLNSAFIGLAAQYRIAKPTPAIRTDATPRRLVLRAEGLAARQPDSEERIWGPARTAPEAAVAGFAKKQGVSFDRLELLSDGKAEKFSYLRTIAGRDTRSILADQLPPLILRTPFPKTMYWTGKGGVRFIRPIRWLVALLDDEVIPFEIAGVQTENQSSGHRKLGAASFPVTYGDYEQKLKENYVILSAEERRSRIRAIPVKYKCDNPLLKTLVNLTEWPTPIVGSFDKAFLDLPKEVLTTVMRHHQKYFSVETSDKQLAPQFVAVTNTDGDPEGLIRGGNERVLRARFNDARFFWNTDQKKKLADRVDDLKQITFQAKLGTYYDKTVRICNLVEELGGDAAARRSALLCKTDLTTELVREFTELQGIIGGLYARAQGENEETAAAIYDHYKPVSMDDSIPRTPAGQLVSVADKLDTLRGCFEAGLIPSGSKDPFALRRAAQGIVKILVEAKLSLPIRSLLGQNAALEEFVFDRVRYYFREVRGFRYDEVNAVLASGWKDLVSVEDRLEALREVRPTENFEPLAASFKRIRNILRQAEFEGAFSPPDVNLMEAGPEAELQAEFERIRSEVRGLGYRGALERIASLRPRVDLFFDKVLVNAPDPAVRRNRLTLLHAILSEFSTIADFSEIVTAFQETK